MTLKELKEEAKKQGYVLVKEPTYEPLAKCSCGEKRSVKFFWGSNGHYYKCVKCGLKGEPSKKKMVARENWNKAVEKAKGE